MKKRVYIVMSHHHAIREWFRYRESKPHLLSFDYHTDFNIAFSGKSGNHSTSRESLRENRDLYLSKHISCNDIGAAIKDLRNDEHIDFALRSGMIEKAFVFSHNGNTFRDVRLVSIPNEKKDFVQAQIFSYCEVAHPLATPYTDSTEAKIAKINTTDEVLNEVIKTFGEYGFNQDDYILDFDCDFIRDKGAMAYDHFKVLEILIKGAKAITIAQEPCCVFGCSGQKLSYDEVEDWLIQLIKGCVDDVQIELDPQALGADEIMPHQTTPTSF